jgi:ParB family transcriptional regulator, chromosome partitioning protein
MMEIINLPLEQLLEAPWNSNQMDEATFSRLRKSIQEYGLVQNLVVRPMDQDKYEVLSGNQRLRVLKEKGLSPVPCVVVDLDDARARLLAQALNHLHGEDDLKLKSELVKNILKTLPEEDVLAILLDTKFDLAALSSMGQENLATYLQNWDRARSKRLRNLQFRLTEEQLELVQKVLNKFINSANRLQSNNPNLRGKALYLLCQLFLKEHSQ